MTQGRQTSVLANMNMSIFSKLWLYCRANGRMGAVSTTTQHSSAACPFADLALLGMLQPLRGRRQNLANCLLRSALS